MTGNSRLSRIIIVILLVTVSLLQFVPSATAADSAGYLYYQVQPGDYLWLIGWKFETTAGDIVSLNHLTSTQINVGQVLKIPVSTGYTRNLPKTVGYTVKQGDTLYLIGQKFGVGFEKIKQANGLTTNSVMIGQALTVPLVQQQRYVVQKGDALYIIAKRFNASIEALQIVNKMNSTVLWIGQVLFVPTLPSTVTTPPVSTTQPPVTGTIPPTGTTQPPVTGTIPPTGTTQPPATGATPPTDTTQPPATGTTPPTDTTQPPATGTTPPGETTQAPPAETTPPTEITQPPDNNGIPPVTIPTLNSIDYSQPLPKVGQWGTIPQGVALYHVQQGENLWVLAQRFHTTEDAIMKTNHLQDDLIQVNQPVFIPQNTSQSFVIPYPTGTQKNGFGELMDWEYASWILNTHEIATIKDLVTGKSFKIRRYGGSNHCDSEPLTADDTAIMNDIYGGQWSWASRAVLVYADGKVLAGSMAGMPHSYDSIPDNNFAGHFDLYFLNSRTHYDNTLSPDHQKTVLMAAGYN